MFQVHILKLLFITLLINLSLQTSAFTLEEGIEPECISEGAYTCNMDTCLCDYGFPGAGFDLTAASLTFVPSMIILIGYFAAKEMREPPGDIIFGFAFADLILSLEWFVQSLVRLELDRAIVPDGSFCITLSYIDETAVLLSSLYNVAFFLFFFMTTRSSLKVTQIPQILYHVVPLLGTAACFSWYLYKRQFGMSLYGVCSIKTNESITIQVLNLLFYTGFPLYMIYVINKTLPQCKKVSKTRYKFIKYYTTYVYVTSFMNVLSAASNIMISADLTRFSKTKDISTELSIIRSMGDVLRMLKPLTLAMFRLCDPLIRQHWKKWFCCFNKRREENLTINLMGQVEKEDFDGRPKLLTLSMRQMEDTLRNTPHLQQIQHTTRVQVLYTVLSSIHAFWRLAKRAPVTTKSDYKKMAKVQHNVKINDEILKKEVPELLQEIRIRDYRVIHGKLTAYGPEVFEELASMDGKEDSLNISLDLHANCERIMKAGIHKGGRSGEFFFFSYDNSLVIKSISDQDLDALLNMLPSYIDHLKTKNPSSLIAKIYGVFTFERDHPHEKFHLVVMKNVSGYPSDCVERMYDLKGSTIARTTVYGGQPSKFDLKHFGTMKDRDFDRFEKKLYIEPKLHQPLLKALKLDSEFLKKNRLMDYSLIVYVIDKEKVPVEFTDSSPSLNNSLNLKQEGHSYIGHSYISPLMISSIETKLKARSNSDSTPKLISSRGEENETTFDIMKSTEENVEYHIGIIDYLTRYTFKKKFERYVKKIAACDTNLDVSAQNHKIYQSRFMSYMNKIVKS